MLTLLWIVAVLAVALVLAYVNASGAAFTAAFAALALWRLRLDEPKRTWG